MIIMTIVKIKKMDANSTKIEFLKFKFVKVKIKAVDADFSVP